MNFIKENLTLILGVAIPIIMIVLVVLSIFLPTVFTKPKYDFIYATGGDSRYSCKEKYLVSNGTLIKKEGEEDKKLKLYLFYTKKNKSSEIYFQETRMLNIDPNIKSADGFEVVQGSQGNGVFLFFFSTTDQKTYYIKGNHLSKKLNLELNGSSSKNFCFLGWIKGKKI